MDLLSLLRTLGGLGIVLGLLAGALWVVRRFDIKLPGRVGGGAVRRLDLVERLAIDNKRTLALIRRDGREHLLLLDPAGAVVIEGGIERDQAQPVNRPEQRCAIPKAGDAPRIAVPASNSPDDMVPFREALNRIQEKARRMRESVVAAPAGGEMEQQPHA